jgi:hypothetical protein
MEVVTMASPALKVLPGGSGGTPYNRFWDAWEWFRTEKGGDASMNTG